MLKSKAIGTSVLLTLLSSFGMKAHTVSRPVTAEDLDTIREKVSALSRFHLGGYAEATYNYNFSSTRVSNADALYEDSRGHSALDIPRIVLMMGVNFGKGWGAEIDVQFENCKDVSIDQFWIEKLFSEQAGLRVGYLTLPVGAINPHDDPLEFFTVNRPEGEDDILPCDWHQAGLSFYGSKGDWGYEAILMPGLNTSMFSEDEWLALDEGGETFSYSRGNTFALAARAENSSVEGLCLGLSGYYGVSFNNRLSFEDGLQQKIRGNVSFLSLDFLYDNYSWVLRGWGSWGRYSKNVKSAWDEMGMNDRDKGFKSAFSASFEGGYDILNLCRKESDQKLYIFGRYDYWQPAEGSEALLGYDWTHRQRVAAGLNYFPIDKVVVKAEYSHSFLPGGKSTPMLSLGVAYSGQFF